MDVTVTQEQGRVPVTVVHLRGNVDSSTSQDLLDQVMAQIQNGAQNVLLDLQHVAYMSSAGLRALNQIYNALRERAESPEAVSKGVTAGTYKSPHLKLLAPSARVLETLKMSGFDMFLDIYPNAKSALAAFQAE